MNILKLNLDLLFLILVYISIKSGFLKTLLSATVIGLITDYFSMNVLGVFGFSRTIIAYFLNNMAKHIDLKNNLLVFTLISISLCLSNLIANTFFLLISGLKYNLNLIVIQPVLTGIMGILIVCTTKFKKYLDVY
jgi:rod shape-determining protein MreD